MSEITKLYENAGINKVCNTCELRGFKRLCPTKELCVRTNPPFTAEKQLDIIKLISKQGQVIIENWEEDNRGFNVTFRANSNLRYITMDCITRKTVEEALAQIVNDIWQDLTKEEKVSIKNILEM